MLTEKQMKSLPMGTYKNTDLQKAFPRHCVGVGLRPDFSVIPVKNGMRTILKNRKQRRAKL